MKRCPAPGCERPVVVAGYCEKHYQQTRRHGRLTPELEYERRAGTCAAEGCDRPVIAKGLCKKHYQQQRRG